MSLLPVDLYVLRQKWACLHLLFQSELFQKLSTSAPWSNGHSDLLDSIVNVILSWQSQNWVWRNWRIHMERVISFLDLCHFELVLFFVHLLLCEIKVGVVILKVFPMSVDRLTIFVICFWDLRHVDTVLRQVDALLVEALCLVSKRCSSSLSSASFLYGALIDICEEWVLPRRVLVGPYVLRELSSFNLSLCVLTGRHECAQRTPSLILTQIPPQIVRSLINLVKFLLLNPFSYFFVIEICLGLKMILDSHMVSVVILALIETVFLSWPLFEFLLLELFSGWFISYRLLFRSKASLVVLLRTFLVIFYWHVLWPIILVDWSFFRCGFHIVNKLQIIK